jgi:hypothetical protein
MIFAREISDNLTSLVKKVDAANAKNKSISSFVVFCSDEEGLEGKLKKLAKDSGLTKTVLAIDNPAGPRGYNVAKNADVTVVLYVRRNVKANHAYKKGELKTSDIEAILKDDLPKILPPKKGS